MLISLTLNPNLYLTLNPYTKEWGCASTPGPSKCSDPADAAGSPKRKRSGQLVVIQLIRLFVYAGSLADVALYDGIGGWPGSPVWQVAYIVIARNAWRHYEDPRLLKNLH
jgi:hypothetical protein